MVFRLFMATIHRTLLELGNHFRTEIGLGIVSQYFRLELAGTRLDEFYNLAGTTMDDYFRTSMDEYYTDNASSRTTYSIPYIYASTTTTMTTSTTTTTTNWIIFRYFTTDTTSMSQYWRFALNRKQCSYIEDWNYRCRTFFTSVTSYVCSDRRCCINEPVI